MSDIYCAVSTIKKETKLIKTRLAINRNRTQTLHRMVYSVKQQTFSF